MNVVELFGLSDFANHGIKVCPFCNSRAVIVQVFPDKVDFEGKTVKILFCQACKQKCGRV